MKLLWAFLFWLALGVALAAGLVRVVEGSPWLLMAVGLGYLLAFVRIGCWEH